MKGYNNSIFYKIKFTIAKTDDEIDLLWRIICHTKGWLLRKWNTSEQNVLPSKRDVWRRLWAGGTISSRDKNVYIQSFAFSDNGSVPYWACKITEKRFPEAGFAPRDWFTEIGIEPISDTEISFSYVVSYEDRPGFIGLCEDEPAPNIPNLIKCILKDADLYCTYGLDAVTVEPIQLTMDNYNSFWDRLCNADRVVPYILINSSYDVEADKYVCAVDPEQMTIAAGGNAMVYYVDDPNVIAALEQIMPSEYRCYTGTIRIYLPNVKLEDVLDPRRHRYIAVQSIESLGKEKTCQMIRRALAQDIHFYETFFQIEDCKKKQEAFARQQRLLEIKAQQEESQQRMLEMAVQHAEERTRLQNEGERTASENYELAIEEEKKRIETELLLDSVEAELNLLKTEYHALTTQIDSYRGLAQKNAELKRVCQTRTALTKMPTTPAELAQYFATVFEDRIAFSSDADKTLKNCRIPLEDMWEHLFALATTMYELWTEKGGDMFADFKQLTGIDVARGEGMMTRNDKRLMRQFVTSYGDEEINIEPHITFSRIRQSIHFGFSEKAQKIVIGSCGEHKEIYSSKKQ